MAPKKRKLSDFTQGETTTMFQQLIKRFREGLNEDDKLIIELLAHISAKLEETQVSSAGS